MERKVLCIVQARMGSSRLPGKVLLKLKEKTIIYRVIDRVNRVKLIDNIIVATTTSVSDDELVDELIKNEINYIRGSEKNVLSRYMDASNENLDYDIIVRITSDCPLIDPELIDDVILDFKNNNYDYISPRSIDGLIRGLDVEVFSRMALENAYKNATKDYEKEHVTPYIYDEKNGFVLGKYVIEDLYKNKEMRLCVDEFDDYEMVKKIYDKLCINDYVSYRDIVKLYESNPEFFKSNLEIKQKGLKE